MRYAGHERSAQRHTFFGELLHNKKVMLAIYRDRCFKDGKLIKRGMKAFTVQ